MTDSRTTRLFVTLVSVLSVMAVTGCVKPGSVKRAEDYLGNEKSAVNSPAAEGAKDAAKNLAKEALGPGGTVVDAGEAVLGSINAGAIMKIQGDADEALLAATLNPNDPNLERRATYLEAKADCFIRKDCKKWYQLNGNPDKNDGGGSGGGRGGD